MHDVNLLSTEHFAEKKWKVEILLTWRFLAKDEDTEVALVVLIADAIARLIAIFVSVSFPCHKWQSDLQSMCQTTY